MPNQFLSDEFGDIEDYFVTDYWLIDNFVGDTLWVWGRNEVGQLGVNDALNKNDPVTTFAGGTNWKSFFSGGSHTVAIKTDGTLWTWGYNIQAQLGINISGGSRSTPVTTFTGGNTWKSLSSPGYGGDYTAAIKTDGSLWTWGYNLFGAIGNNTSTNRSTPVTTFAGGNNWKSLSTGASHMAAIKTDGSLWTWGSNGTSGSLGINNSVLNSGRSTPVTTFAGGNSWKQVSCGGSYTAAIKTDGSLWIWGSGTSGQLGNNAATDRSTPVTTFAGGNDWKSVTCGSSHTAAIKTDGSLWVWGSNSNGKLGINNTANRSIPVTTFVGGTNWKQISCGGQNHTAAIKTDGTLWAWGNNLYGQINNTFNVDRSIPSLIIAGGNNWKQVDCGQSYTAAVKSGLNVDLS